ncbi:MAG: type II toxin-antitoxin system VapC family toxin [Chloroflexi bacterium]|nr:type II toxin-antitoxin system VapC family toxin [Chloroflexota bacterium]
MSDYLLDTNILILCFRKTEGYRELLDTLAKDDTLYISAITRLEIVRGMHDHEKKATFNLLDSLETIDVTIEIADKAGELIRQWRTKGIILGDADAVIAATALNHGLALVTTNEKHFPMTDLVVYQANRYGKLTLRE